jgi:hypothetical protein
VMSGVSREGVPEALRALIKVIDGEREPIPAGQATTWTP